MIVLYFHRIMVILMGNFLYVPMIFLNFPYFHGDFPAQGPARPAEAWRDSGPRETNMICALICVPYSNKMICLSNDNRDMTDIYIYIYVYIDIYIYVLCCIIYVCVFKYMYMYIDTVYIYIYTVYIYTRIYIYIYTVYIYTYIVYIHIYIYACIYIYISCETYNQRTQGWIWMNGLWSSHLKGFLTMM